MIEAALFLCAVAALVFTLPQGWRPPVLLFASVLFYCWLEPHSWPVLLFSTVIGIGGSHRLETYPPGRQRRWLFAGLIVLLLLPLVAFKYLGMARTAVPLGLSFFTFQIIGYVADVYRGRLASERSWIFGGLFCCFFPIITAGPIERGGNLLPQLRKIGSWDYERVRLGTLQILTGVFKKVVIADGLAPWIEAVYYSPDISSGYTLYAATVLLRYQIFADFAGYTDIALGSARVLGIRLQPNFARPFAASSIGDHWRRWHISLSQWIRDYVFFPLIGSRVSRLGLYPCLILTFLLLGLWHGATWCFAAYGIVQGVLLSGNDYWRRRAGSPAVADSGIKKAGKVAFTFLILVALPTVFFRAADLAQAGRIFAAIAKAPFSGLPTADDFTFLNSSGAGKWPFVLLVIAAFEVIQWLDTRRPVVQRLDEIPRPLRWAIYLGIAVVFLLLGNFGEPQDIVYRKI